MINDGPLPEVVARLRKEYPVGCRVELVRMQDAHMGKLKPGCQGTVRWVDDMGTIHVSWECGSSLGVVFGIDECRRIDDGEV